MTGEVIAQESWDGVEGATQRDTFLRLIEQYEPSLRRLAAGYADQAADREDLFQDVAMGIWQAIPKFRGEASERTWLYRIAHNIAISSSTWRNTRGKREEGMSETFDAPSPVADGEQQALRSEKQRMLLQAIRKLAAIDRQIVLLHLEGLNYAEIEEISGLSQSAIATRLSRARDRLKEMVQAGTRAEKRGGYGQ